MESPLSIPDPAIVVLVGPSGSGKSTWARARYGVPEIVSSDGLRRVVGTGPNDLDASADAFALLDQIMVARARRGLTTVVDTLGLDGERRVRLLGVARRADLPAVVVLFDTDARTCRQRNAARDRPVPADALEGQVRRMRAAVEQVTGEGWDLVLQAEEKAHPEPQYRRGVREAALAQERKPTRLGFVLQIGRFRWEDDPAGWLTGVASAASAAGFVGIALTDHLIQIPQVGRAWEPIPEPNVTLGLLAGLTSDLRLGTLVTPVTFRPPGVVAKAVATLDVLSGGRAFCGLGAGWWEREHAGFGLGFPNATERLDQLETAVETMRALWSPGTKEYVGERVRLPETTCYPRPLSNVPIIIGGGGERRTLRIAARYADGCNVRFSDLETLDRKVATLRRHCAELGRDPDEVEVTVLDIPVIGTDRDDVAAKVERLRGRASAAAFAKRHHAGSVADHVGRYRLLADRGVSTVFLSLPDLAGPEQVAACGPLVAAFR